MKYSAVIIKHFSLALKLEISRLQKVYARVGDDRLAWFDPNDIPLFGIMLRQLEETVVDSLELDNIKNKPYSFMMEGVSRYVNENIEKFDDQAVSEIIRFWDQYATRFSA